MDVDDRDIGRIVGRGGCNIRDLQELTPVKKTCFFFFLMFANKMRTSPRDFDRY